MNESDYVVGFLNPRTQKAYAAKAECPNIALLRRVERIVLGSDVTNLAEARARLNGLIEAEKDSLLQK